jgi:hypothetical protein
MSLRATVLLPLFGAFTLACDNPTVDPAADVTAWGEVMDTFDRPLSGAEVRLVKYWSDTNARRPTAEQVFADDPGRAADEGLQLELVATTRASRRGRFEFRLSGSDIAQPGGRVDERGRVEVADTVIAVRDPADPLGRSGAYTYGHTYQQTDLDWDAGRLRLWDADGRVEVAGPDVELSWRAVEPRERGEDDAYRVVIEPPSGGRRLVLGCSARSDGRCTRSSDIVRLRVSAATLDRYYTSPGGDFSAWVQADGRDHRAVAELRGGRIDSDPGREPAVFEGVWAAGDAGEEDLLGSAAVDGDPTTRARVSGRVTEVYVKLRPTVITDAGLLGAYLSGAADGCVEVEFTGTSYADVITARTSADIDWQPRGRFCGENGGPGEVSALVSFAGEGGVTFAWMRLRAVPFDRAGTQPVFREIGEVAVFTR